MPYQKGQSGNPNGRPPKNRTLTTLLEKGGNKTIVDKTTGRHIARKRVIARMAWELLTEGKTTLPNGEILQLDPVDWLGLFKWLYQHIDGPPTTKMDITSAGEQITQPEIMRPSEIAAIVAAMQATDDNSIRITD